MHFPVWLVQDDPGILRLTATVYYRTCGAGRAGAVHRKAPLE